MAASVYTINKGINKSIQFKGLKAQYIGWLAGGMIAVMILFAFLYIIGINAYICVSIAMGLGVLLLTTVYRFSHQYGEFGMMKKMAERSVPKQIRSKSRKIFIQLKK